MKRAKENTTGSTWLKSAVMAAVLIALVALLAGCESDEDCLNCVEPPIGELPPPVVPTGVHTISGDNLVIVQWYDISYAPYDGTYSPNVEKYVIYSRFFEEGDQNDPNREFYYIGEVAWDENYDDYTGLHWFDDIEVENGFRYEYAVAAVNAAGKESALSFELVLDAPLPMSPYVNGNYIAVELFDGNGAQANKSGFDFAKAAANQGNINAGRVDPTVDPADFVIYFENGVPYVDANPSRVVLQDFGVFTSGGSLIFEGVSWAPADGYSQTGKIELVAGHIYVVEIRGQALHYAKFGVTGTYQDTVDIIWAYQTIPGLPELKAPEDLETGPAKPQIVSF
ncbi:MAG: hypothetical protein ABFS42_09175 [Candidatus Krumholzibacteriota bacterium]